MARWTKEDQQQAEQRLREVASPGTTLYTVLRHVSRSGMMRVLDVYVIRNNEPLRITRSVAALLDYPYNRTHDGVTVTGCGMDMGFQVVYEVSRKLYGTNADGSDGGYNLNHRWL